MSNYPSNALHIILQTLKFKALLLVHLFASSSSFIAHQPQELIISCDPSIPIVDLSADDVIFNPITFETQLCKLGDGKPWKGPKKKSERVMQLFITSLSLKDGIVADLTASTGNQYFFFFYFLTAYHCFILINFSQFYYSLNSSTFYFPSFFIMYCLWNVLFYVLSSIKAACSSNRHILALEADSKLFEEVLEPLKKATPLSKSHDTNMSRDSSKDDENSLALDQPFINLCD